MRPIIFNHKVHKDHKGTAPMRRRFQFSLRTLMILVVLLCVALGTWQVYLRYFTSFVELATTPVGQAIQVRGRFVRFGGSPSTAIAVYVRPIGKSVIAQSGSSLVQKTGWGTYEFDIKLSPIQRPGEYDVTVSNLKETAALGTLTIVPPSAATP